LVVLTVPSYAAILISAGAVEFVALMIFLGMRMPLRREQFTEWPEPVPIPTWWRFATPSVMVGAAGAGVAAAEESWWLVILLALLDPGAATGS
jgi:hypothetical protein